MDILLGLTAIIGGLVAMDVAAMRWGKNARRSGWLHNGYDPRREWHNATQ